jgi:transcription antitermination factor NusG
LKLLKLSVSRFSGTYVVKYFREVYMSPEILQRFPEERPLAADIGRWLVAVVRPRQEKALARDLEGVGIPYYLPLVCKVHRRPDNHWPKKAIVPLFPGYVAAAGLESRLFLHETGRVKQVLRVADQEGFIRELENVQRALRSGLPVELHPSIPVGSLVKITHGALIGVSGRVERIEKHRYLVICVELFQQCVRVKLPPHEVTVHRQPIVSHRSIPSRHVPHHRA